MSAFEISPIYSTTVNTVDIDRCTKDDLYSLIAGNEHVFITGCFKKDPTGEKEQVEDYNATLTLLGMLSADEVIKTNPNVNIYITGLKLTTLPDEALMGKTKLRFSGGVWAAGLPRPEMMIRVKTLSNGNDRLQLSGMNFIPSNFGKDQFDATLSLAPGALGSRPISTTELIIQAILKGGNCKKYPAKSIRDPITFEKNALKHSIVVNVEKRTVYETAYETLDAFIEAYNDAVVAIMCLSSTLDKKAKELGQILALDEMYFTQSKRTCIPIGELGHVDVCDIGLNIIAQV